jgi:hypothetical protein
MKTEKEIRKSRRNTTEPDKTREKRENQETQTRIF